MQRCLPGASAAGVPSGALQAHSVFSGDYLGRTAAGDTARPSEALSCGDHNLGVISTPQNF